MQWWYRLISMGRGVSANTCSMCKCIEGDTACLVWRTIVAIRDKIARRWGRKDASNFMLFYSRGCEASRLRSKTLIYLAVTKCRNMSVPITPHVYSPIKASSQPSPNMPRVDSFVARKSCQTGVNSFETW